MVDQEKTVDNSPKSYAQTLIEAPTRFPVANIHRLINEISEMTDENQLLSLREAVRVAIERAQSAQARAQKLADEEKARPDDERDDEAAEEHEDRANESGQRATAFVEAQLMITERLASLEAGKPLDVKEVVKKMKTVDITNEAELTQAGEYLIRLIKQVMAEGGVTPRTETTGAGTTDTAGATTGETDNTTDAVAPEGEAAKNEADKEYTDAVAVIEAFDMKDADEEIAPYVRRAKIWISVNSRFLSLGVLRRRVIDTAKKITEHGAQAAKVEKFKPVVTALEASGITKSVVDILAKAPLKDGKLDVEKMSKDKALTADLEMLKVQLLFMVDLGLINLPAWITTDDQDKLQYRTAVLEKLARTNPELAREFFSSDKLMESLKAKTTNIVIETTPVEPPKPPTKPAAGSPPAKPGASGAPAPTEATAPKEMTIAELAAKFGVTAQQLTDAKADSADVDYSRANLEHLISSKQYDDGDITMSILPALVKGDAEAIGLLNQLAKVATKKV